MIEWLTVAAVVVGAFACVVAVVLGVCASVTECDDYAVQEPLPGRRDGPTASLRPMSQLSSE